MTEAFRIRGGKALAGEIRVGGSKNDALAILAGTVLAAGRVALSNVPRIRDVEHVLEILKGLGAMVERQGDTVLLDTKPIASAAPSPELTRKLRGSVLLAGALVGRFGEATMPFPGGDAIGARPIDTHLHALGELGVTVAETKDHFLTLSAPDGLLGSKVVLRESSVTATENAMLAGFAAKGKTMIKLSACEPHVEDLARFLKKLGARISGAGTHTITISRDESFRPNYPISHRIIPDNDEAMNFAVLAAATRGNVTISGIEPEDIEAGIRQLREMKVNLETGDSWLRIKKPVSAYRAAKIQSGLYPKLMSDQVPPFATLATQAEGTSLIHEWMYEGRLANYMNELIKMGANAMILDPHRAIVIGPTPLRGSEVKALDVRTGITTIIAALVAEGESILHEAFHVDRGFANIEERLGAIGAEITRIVPTEA